VKGNKFKMSKQEDQIYYGGQAVMEGILMRGTKAYAMAVRRPNGEIAMIEKPISTITQRYPFLKWPLIRGVVALCSSMALGFSALSQSADIAMEDETPPTSSFEKFLADKLGDKVNDILKIFAMIIAVVIAIGLFMLLPAFLGSLLPIHAAWTGIIEGLIRITIFVSYIFIVSRSKDIQRVFQYHGAEHKAINCHEANLSLTAENVASCNRLHKRCGTSFMLVVMVVTMLLFMIIQVDGIWLRFASRILLLPVIAGISYEVSVKWAGRHDNFFVNIITAPGMLMQRLTTGEPDEGQIEIAITALNKCLEQENPIKLPEVEFEAVGNLKVEGKKE